MFLLKYDKSIDLKNYGTALSDKNIFPPCNEKTFLLYDLLSLPIRINLCTVGHDF